MGYYAITREGLELPVGASYKTNEADLLPGDMCLCKIGKLVIVGRWIPGWILQPGRWIRIKGDAILKSLGR